MPATFDKEAYRAIREEVRRNIAATRLQHYFLMSCMRALAGELRIYRGTFFHHEGNREDMKALSAQMAFNLQMIIQRVNTTRRLIFEYFEQSEEKRQAEANDT